VWGRPGRQREFWCALGIPAVAVFAAGTPPQPAAPRYGSQMRVALAVAAVAVAGTCTSCGGSSTAAPAVTVRVTTSTTVTSSVTVTATVSATPPVVAATEVRACESAHGLSAAHEQTSRGDETRFASCSWPAALGADQDGYLAITSTESETGLDEASNESEFDLVSGPCTAYTVGYSFGDMGVHMILPLVTVAQGSVLGAGSGTSPVNLAAAGAPDVPYPVYLHNASYTLNSVSCAP
jgi:hypothetical protein